MNCPACDFANPEETRFCGGCGADLGHACPDCGGHNPSRFRFCGQCGSSLEVAAEPPDPRALPSQPAARAPAERRQLTVFFCDLVGSTPLAESMDAEDLRSVVSQYHAVCEREVKKLSGSVAQFLGDGVLVYFGYPRAHEDDGERAIRAALAIQHSIARLNESLEARGHSPLRVRIGIHTGSVVIGQIGRSGRHEIQATGDTMNVAARLQGIAAGGSVVVSDATLRLVSGLFVTRDLGRPDLKGVSSPPQAYEVIEESGVQERLQRAAKLTPFAGRRSELEALEHAWQHARQGHGQIVLLSGEAGIGKSRLVHELRRRDDGDVQRSWLMCRCSSHHQNSALYPIIEAVERSFGIDRRMPPADRAALVAENVERLELPASSAALLSGLLSLPVADSELPASPDVRRRQTLRLLCDVMRRLAQRTPLVLVIEDLHWADPTTLDLLARLAPRIADDPLLLLLVARPGTSLVWPPPPYQSTIEVGRISESDAEAILDAWSVGRNLHPEIQHAIVSRTDGVPLFLEELTRSLLDSKLLDRLSDGPGRVEAHHLIPSTLRDSLAARLDALGPARETIQIGALLGRRFSRSLLAAVHECEPYQLEEHLAALVDADLLIRTGNPPDYLYVFKHALIQDTAVETLLRSRRRELHQRAARALERDFPELTASEPETLARHCEEAGEHEKAGRLFRRAGTRAEAHWAYVEAAGHHRRSLALLAELEPSLERDELELQQLEDLARPLTATVGYGASELGGIYQRERELLATLGNRVDEFPVLRNIWGYHCVHGDREATLEAADAMLAISHRSERVGVRALANWIVGATAFYTGDQTRARDYLQVAVDRHRDTLHRRETGMGDQLFLACLVHGWSRILAGDVDTGLGLLDEGIDHAEKLDDPFALTQALTHLAMALYDLGRPSKEIHGQAERALTLARRHKLVQTLRSSQLNLGWCMAVDGDEAGLLEIRQAIEVTRSVNFLNPLGTMLTVLADAELRLDRIDDALTTLDEAFDVFRTNICRHHEPLAYVLQARALALRDDPSGAENALRRAVRIAGGQGAALFELQAAVDLVRLVCANGIVPEAVAILRDARSRHPQESSERFCRDADALVADLAELERGHEASS